MLLLCSFGSSQTKGMSHHDGWLNQVEILKLQIEKSQQVELLTVCCSSLDDFETAFGMEELGISVELYPIPSNFDNWMALDWANDFVSDVPLWVT